MDKIAEMLSFQGRANRAWYFWHGVLDNLVLLTAIVLAVVVGVATNPLFGIPFVGVALATLWSGVAITAKRLHDLDRPSWQIVLFAIPLVNIYIGLIALFKQGTIGPNQYGPDPLGAAVQSQVGSGTY
ncbi:MAG: DUF805 domain-containing protein [Longimicrobiales bacterium]